MVLSVLVELISVLISGRLCISFTVDIRHSASQHIITIIIIVIVTITFWVQQRSYVVDPFSNVESQLEILTRRLETDSCPVDEIRPASTLTHKIQQIICK